MYEKDKLKSYIGKLDAQGKIGWIEEYFNELSEKEKVVISAFRFINNIRYNGLIDYLKSNETFYWGYVYNKVSDKLNMISLKRFMRGVESELNYYGLSVGDNLEKLKDNHYNILEKRLEKYEEGFTKTLDDRIEDRLNVYLL